MELQSIEECWHEFANMVLPPNVSNLQREEMKKSFYAGAWSMFSMFDRVGQPDISEAAAVVWLGERRQEAIDYANKVMADYGERN